MPDDITFFKFEKILNFSTPIYLVKIANGHAVALTKNILLRFMLNDPTYVEKIPIPSENDLGYTLFIDPSGNHVIVCMQSSQSFYLTKSLKKFRLMKDAKGYLLNAVGWNVKQTCESTTSNILIGTQTGEIFETKLYNATTFVGEQYWNRIYTLEHAITGIIFDSYPDSNYTKFFLVITTPTSLYPIYVTTPAPCKGTSIFAAEFEKISKQAGGPKHTTLPHDFGYSDISQFYIRDEQFPKFISWMNGSGIYWATVNPNFSEAESNIFVRPKFLNYSSSKKDCKPINIANTEFHIILQYADDIHFFCIIHDEIVHTYKYQELGKEQFRGLSKDFSTGYIYTFSNHNIFRINCDAETKNLWRTYLKLGNYDLAYKYCNNEEEKIKINMKHAENLYDQEKYVESAKLYASTLLSFEEATLKFIDLESKEGLKSYLLEYINHHKSDTTLLQNYYDIISIWLLEIYFEEINTEQFKTGSEITNAIYKLSNEQYKKFVENPQIIKAFKRNKVLIYEKIKNYGDLCHSGIFADIIGDSLKIIEHHIENGNTKDALLILANETLSKPHYIFGPKIIQTHPNELVNIWIKLSHRLDVKKILPILRTIEDSIAIKYVQFMIRKNDTDKSHARNPQQCNLEELHNFYVLLCAKLAKKRNQSHKNDELMSYLRIQGINPLQTNYDPQLALRICVEYKHLEGSVFLHCLLQKNKEAVDLALNEKNLELAQEVALKFTGSEEVKKHLWLQIAKFIIHENKDVEEVCNLVRSQHSLKLEDILPYFPDSAKIEDFADAICDSLQFYNQHIENLKQDMKSANGYATKTRDEINFLKQRPISVPGDTKCVYCNELLTLRPFCLFPCKHFFHIHCLEKVTIPILIQDPNCPIIQIKEKLASNNIEEVNLKMEYQKLIATDCCYCGSLTIDIIDKPIISLKEFDNEMKQWD